MDKILVDKMDGNEVDKDVKNVEVDKDDKVKKQDEVKKQKDVNEVDEVDKGKKIMNRQNTNFMYELFNWLKELKIESEWDFLTYYQYLTKYFYTKIDIGTRGMLIYYTMGMGKTILAVAIAMALSEYDPILLSSVSLHENFINTIKQFIKMKTKNDPSFKLGTMDDSDLNKWILKKFKFVTLKASNMMNQLSLAANNLDKLNEEIAIDIKNDMKANKKTSRVNEFTEQKFDDPFDGEMNIDSKLKELISLDSLDGKLLIVDEAHNLFRSITNGSKNGIILYDLIMKSKNMKILFLTGTPIAKDPFELVPCFNMLGGYYDQEDKQDAARNERLVLPERYNDFYKYFVDEKTNLVKNKSKFQNRIVGLVSYVSHTSHIGERSNIDLKTVDIKSIEFPKENPLIIRYVNMDDTQYVAYLLARETEKKEALKKSKYMPLHIDPLTIPGRGSSSTFRIRSRQISNFWMKGLDFKKNVVNDVSPELTESPKFKQMLLDTNKEEGIGMVFSQLLHMCGLESYAKYLQHNGWSQFDIKNQAKRNLTLVNGGEKSNEKADDKNPTKDPRVKSYAFISGDMDQYTREEIRKILISPNNMNGEIISLILISQAGAEGLDLKNIRYIQFIEPPWTKSYFEQVKFRGIRGNSHIMLPPEKRNVNVYLYLSVRPKQLEVIFQKEKKIRGEKVVDSTTEYTPQHFHSDFEDTTDVVIWNNSSRIDITIKDFESTIQNASIECFINGGEHCHMCNPTSQELFVWNIKNDLFNKDPCVALKEIKKKLNKIIINNTDYYWEPNTESVFKYSVYYFDKKINNYKRMPESDILFMTVVENIK